MKKVILTTALVFGLFVISSESYGQAIKYYSTEVMDEINATPEQRAVVKELSKKYSDQYKALKADKSLSKEEVEAQRKKLMRERSKGYWEVLTPEQTKYLREKRDKLRAEKNNK